MKKLEWHNEKRKVNDLLPFSKNPRSIDDVQISNLKRSLKKFNLAEVPAIDVDNKIAAGHQRIKVLQLLGRGDEIIDVRVPNRKLTPKEYEQYLLTSNAVTGDWDFEKLKSFDIDTLLDIGFDEDTLSSLWDENLETEADDFDLEKELAKIKTPKTKPGEMFILGSHKLICGDCNDPEVVKKLFGKDKASVIFSDPIYNINLDYNGGIGGKKQYGGTVKDKMSDDEYFNFLRKSLENALAISKDNLHIFYWCDQLRIGMLQQIYKELGISNKRVCMWVKNSQNPTPNVAFNKCYESCVYGTKGSPTLGKNVQSLNEIFNKEISTGNRLIDDILDLWDIWLVKRLAGNEYEHPTMKPPTLYEKALRRCSNPGDIILDSFAGSGSLLIAAEQLKRKAYLVEIEPIFCDLIINRYESYAKQKAKKLN